MAGRAGVLVPDVIAAGRFGPSRDAALVTSLPDGVVLSEAAGADLADGTLDEMLRAVLWLRNAGLAHGALGGDAILVSGRGICVRDFRCASASAPARAFLRTRPSRRCSSSGCSRPTSPRSGAS